MAGLSVKLRSGPDEARPALQPTNTGNDLGLHRHAPTINMHQAPASVPSFCHSSAVDDGAAGPRAERDPWNAVWGRGDRECMGRLLRESVDDSAEEHA